MIKELNFKKVFGNVRIVYLNYTLSTYKFRRNYHNKYYKAIIDYLAAMAPQELTRREFNKVVPYLEQLDPRSMKILCELAKSGNIEIMVNILRTSTRWMKGDPIPEK